jgi:hypothetical protein
VGSGRPPDHLTPQIDQAQRVVCSRFGVLPDPADPSSKVGIALQTRGQEPLNGSRKSPEGGTCGWYLWWGDTLNEDPDFFKPLHVAHLEEYCPIIVPYLALPPGWRVQLAPGHEDVWFDEELLRD